MVDRKAAGLLPDEFGEGGKSMPWGKNLRCKARVIVGQFVTGTGVVAVPWNTLQEDGKPCAVGLELVHTDDEGKEYNPQFYSAGRNTRGVPSEDGKKPSDEGRYIITNPETETDFQIHKGTIIAKLLEETINAGYDKKVIKDAAGDLVAVFDGLYAHWTGTKPPTFEGQAPRKASSVMSVPDLIIDMPGGKKGKKAAKKTEEVSDDDQEEALGKMVKVAKAMLKEEDEVSRADFVAQLNEQYEDDDQLELMAELAYDKAFKKALAKKDMEIDGETIKKEE